MTEKELLEAVKRNDDEAFKELMNHYHNMIYSIINGFTLKFGDYRIPDEELYQEGCIALYEACKTYGKVQDCKFSTFAYIVIKRRIHKFAYNLIKIYSNESASFDKYTSTDKMKLFESKYVYDNPIYYSKDPIRKYDFQSRMSKLDPFDQKLIQLRLQNYSYDEIARIMNITKKRVDNRLQYIKRRKLNNNKF